MKFTYKMSSNCCRSCEKEYFMKRFHGWWLEVVLKGLVEEGHQLTSEQVKRSHLDVTNSYSLQQIYRIYKKRYIFWNTKKIGIFTTFQESLTLA